MPRLLVVECDAARRDALMFVLTEAGFRAKAVAHVEVAHELATHRVALLLIGDGDLRMLDDLPRRDGSLTVPVLTLVDPGNIAGILGSLSAGARGVLSRERSPDEIVAKVKSLLKPAELNDSNTHLITIDEDGSLQERTYEESELIEALGAACEDITRLQKRYEAELSQRRKVEQALMESEAFYHSLVETLPLALLRKDLQGRFTFVNRLLRDAFRKTDDACTG